MYAVVETGGKQYRVSPGEVLDVESLEGPVGETITLGRVLMVQGEKSLTIGSPAVKDARVTAEVMAHGRLPKVMVFKKKRRKNYRRTKGHRQGYTRIKISEIQPAT